jgi:hypothetical protein
MFAMKVRRFRATFSEGASPEHVGGIVGWRGDPHRFASVDRKS